MLPYAPSSLGPAPRLLHAHAQWLCPSKATPTEMPAGPAHPQATPTASSRLTLSGPSLPKPRPPTGPTAPLIGYTLQATPLQATPTALPTLPLRPLPASPSCRLPSPEEARGLQQHDRAGHQDPSPPQLPDAGHRLRACREAPGSAFSGPGRGWQPRTRFLGRGREVGAGWLLTFVD